MTSPARALSRRLAAVAVVAVLLLVAGCSAGSGDADQDVTLRFAWWGNGDRAALTRTAIEEFEAANPTIKVQGETSEFGAYFDKLATQTAANDAPDVFTLGGAYPAEYANRGALADLGQLSDLDLTGIDRSALQNGQVGGVQYGVSTGSNALSIVANPAVFRAAGVPMPDDATWTWAEFAALATRISAQSTKGTYGTATPLTHDSLDAFARQRGESLYTADGKLGLTHPTLAAFFQTSLSLTTSGAAPSASITVEQTASAPDQTLMAQGKAAMMLNWSNSVSTLSTASGERLVLLRLPGETPTPGIWLQSSQFYAIGSRSEHQQAAAKLVSFLVNDEAAAKTLLTDRGVPANPTMRTAIKPSLSAESTTEVAYIDQVADTGSAPTFIGPVGSTAVADITTRIGTEVLFGRTSPDDAATAWLSESEAAISR